MYMDTNISTAHEKNNRSDISASKSTQRSYQPTTKALRIVPFPTAKENTSNLKQLIHNIPSTTTSNKGNIPLRSSISIKDITIDLPIEEKHVQTFVFILITQIQSQQIPLSVPNTLQLPPSSTNLDEQSGPPYIPFPLFQTFPIIMGGNTYYAYTLRARINSRHPC